MPVSTEPITLRLSPEISARVNRKIAESGYLDAEDVIVSALNALDPEEAELEPWMLAEIGEACDELDRDPSQVLTMEELNVSLKAEYAKASASS